MARRRLDIRTNMDAVDYFDDHEDARRCARALAAWPMRRIVKETTRFISVKDWSPRE